MELNYSRAQSASQSLAGWPSPPNPRFKVWLFHPAPWAKAEGRFLTGSCPPCSNPQQETPGYPSLGYCTRRPHPPTQHSRAGESLTFGLLWAQV